MTDIRVAAEQARVALTSLARGFSTCPLRPLYTVHTAEEMDSWWMARNIQNEAWVSSTARAALASLEAALAAQPEQQQGQGLVHPAMSTSGRTSVEGGVSPAAASQGWQPIETAPKDGTVIFTFWLPASPRDPLGPDNYGMARFKKDEWRNYENDEEFGRPDYWMPLQPPIAHSLHGSPARTVDGQMNQKESHD